MITRMIIRMIRMIKIIKINKMINKKIWKIISSVTIVKVHYNIILIKNFYHLR